VDAHAWRGHYLSVLWVYQYLFVGYCFASRHFFLIKRNYMRTKFVLSIIISVLIFTDAFAQKKYTGYFCTGVNENTPFQYSKEYIEKKDTFITLYKIYSYNYGYYLNITATHYKTEKKTVVSIDDITVKTNGHISSQEITYENPSMTPFGIVGYFKATVDAQNRLPDQLALKFFSSKFENVNIISVVKDDNLNSLKWYVLDNPF
jgi:hypothetical protein